MRGRARLAGGAALLAILLPVLAPAPGCSYRRLHAGDPAFLERDPRDLDWRPGITTARQVAAALGPPDRIAERGERLVFVYRFQRDVRTGFVVNVYLKLFSADRVRRVDGTLVAVFDEADRLLHYGTSEAVP